jgi:uncharacterized GH25 family protein
MKTPIRIAVAIAAALTPALAQGHEFWLSPSVYAIAPGQATAVTARTGEAFCGPAKTWARERSVRFLVRTSRLINLTDIAFAGDGPWVKFAPTDKGGAMLAFESTFTPIHLPGAKFNAYLAEEGLTGPLAARGESEESGRERYRRCAKTWLSGDDAKRATEPMGLPLEIVPSSIPGRDTVLVVTVLRGGQPLAGALVRAWRAPLGAAGVPLDAARRDSSAMAWEGRTGADGMIAVPVRESGEWLVSLVDMAPSAEPSEADWESTWASLTFARNEIAR